MLDIGIYKNFFSDIWPIFMALGKVSPKGNQPVLALYPVLECDICGLDSKCY